VIEHAARLVFGDLVSELTEHEGQLSVLDASDTIFIELLERNAPTLLRRIAMRRTGTKVAELRWVTVKWMCALRGSNDTPAGSPPYP